MSTAGRKAAKPKSLPAQNVGGVMVPSQYLPPVDINERRALAIGELASAKRARFELAFADYDKEVAKHVAAGMPPDKAAFKASRKLDAVADLVRQHANEAKADDGTVLLDVAAALMSLDAPRRQMILRRAGNPEVFSALEDAVLTGADGATGGLGDEANVKQAVAAVTADDDQRVKAGSRERFPVSQRPSQYVRQEGQVAKKSGKPKKPSEIYKEHLISDSSPLEVDTSERDYVRATQGDEAARAVPLSSTEASALNTLAGDQLAAIRAILKRQREEAGYSESLFKKLDPEQQAQVDLQIHAGAFLPDVVAPNQRAMEERALALMQQSDGQRSLRFRRKDDILTVGTSQARPQGRSQKSAAFGGSARRQPIDRAVESRNRSPLDKLLALMYEMTEPRAMTDLSTGGVQLDHNDRPAAAAPSDTYINLNRHLPIWRARIGVPDSTGALQYPSNAVNPKWFTEFLQAFLNSDDPNFVPRMLPLIERSVALTPDQTGNVLLPGGELQRARSAAGVKKNAGYYDAERFTPSPKMKAAMEAGPGTAHYPTPVYGDRVLNRTPLEAPPLTPAPLDTNHYLDAIRQFQERLRQQPGNTDTSSIYMVPQNSPVRYLMA